MSVVKNYVFVNKKITIYQNKKMFNFSLDTLLISCFGNYDSAAIIFDFGTNNGAIPLILKANGHHGKIYGIEIQKKAAQLAFKNIQENNFTNIEIINETIQNYVARNHNICDVVICNPPFFKYSKFANTNKLYAKTIARHEAKITLKEIIENANFSLKNKGKLILVHDAKRLDEIINELYMVKMYPKIIQFVHSKINNEADKVLILAQKNARIGLRILKPIIIHDANGNYSLEIKKFYQLKENNYEKKDISK